MNPMAYIDPGTGSLVIQALIAGFLGALFALRKWLYGTFQRFRMMFSKPGNDADDEQG